MMKMGGKGKRMMEYEGTDSNKGWEKEEKQRHRCREIVNKGRDIKKITN